MDKVAFMLLFFALGLLNDSKGQRIETRSQYSNMQFVGQQLKFEDQLWHVQSRGWSLYSNTLLPIDSLHSLSIDSNARSFVDFTLGSNNNDGNPPNQDVELGLIRPTSKGLVIFGLSRISNSGWYSNNYERYREAELQYLHQFNNRLSSSIGAHLSTLNLELNGGFLDSTFLFESDLGENEFLVIDYGSENGISNQREFQSNINIDYRLESSGLKLLGEAFWNNSNYTYEDVGAINAYFAKYPELRLGHFKDSIIQNQIGFNLGVSNQSRLYPDSCQKQLFYGVFIEGSGTSILNNGGEFSYIDLRPIGQLRYSGKVLDHRIKARYAVLGLKRGETDLDYRIRLKVKSDSAFSSHAFLSPRYQRSLMPFQFFRYRSNLVTIAENLKLVNDASVSGGFTARTMQLDLAFEFSGHQVSNYTIIEKNTTIKQLNVTYFSVSSKLNYENNWLVLSNSFDYQWTPGQYEFSLPEIVNTGRVSFKTPLFKKALYVKPGFDVLYYSSYYAMGYHPGLNVYYVQNDREFGNYFRSDFFFQAQVKTVDVEFRVVNLNYDWFGQEPLVGPNYPGLPRFIQIGLKWQFKN